MEYSALCWSCEEEKVFLVMFWQEGGLERVKLCLEEEVDDMKNLTIGWEEALCDP